MNLELLESFGQNYPEESDGVLECGGGAVCCKFNRWGSLLAVGCTDGKAILFDFITRQPCKTISAHVLPISSLSWSRNGSRLLTGSGDCTVALWDAATGECLDRYRFPSNVLKVQFHPRNRSLFLVCIVKYPCVLVNATDASHIVVPCDDESTTCTAAEVNVTASFDRRGQHLLAGNGRGRVTVFDTDTLRPVASFRLQSNHAIRSLEFARRGDTFLTNSTDRVIRVFDLREVLVRGVNCGAAEPMQKLTDMVNKAFHRVWDRPRVKILHGAKGEQLMDVQWHPGRPVICSVASGNVGVWTQSHVENWSAFAPDFRELDENVEYEERESEFDIEDEDRSVEFNPAKADEDEMVDVTTTKAPQAFCSSDEEDLQGNVNPKDDQPLWFLSVAPEIEPSGSAQHPGADHQLVVDGSSGQSHQQGTVPAHHGGMQHPGADVRPAVGMLPNVAKQVVEHVVDIKPLLQDTSASFAPPSNVAPANANSASVSSVPSSRKRSSMSNVGQPPSRSMAKHRRVAGSGR